MEMHQIRYFLAVARTLNFTRAADACNVTQPSLTRAIKQLEAELGGDLFRRERPAGLTELGQRMQPLLKQCYEAALGACSLASFFKSGEVAKTWALQQVGGYLGYTRSDAAQMPICGRSQPDQNKLFVSRTYRTQSRLLKGPILQTQFSSRRRRVKRTAICGSKF